MVARFQFMYALHDQTHRCLVQTRFVEKLNSATKCPEHMLPGLLRPYRCRYDGQVGAQTLRHHVSPDGFCLAVPTIAQRPLLILKTWRVTGMGVAQQHKTKHERNS